MCLAQSHIARPCGSRPAPLPSHYPLCCLRESDSFLGTPPGSPCQQPSPPSPWGWHVTLGISRLRAQRAPASPPATEQSSWCSHGNHRPPQSPPPSPAPLTTSALRQILSLTCKCIRDYHKWGAGAAAAASEPYRQGGH